MEVLLKGEELITTSSPLPTMPGLASRHPSPLHPPPLPRLGRGRRAEGQEGRGGGRGKADAPSPSIHLAKSTREARGGGKGGEACGKGAKALF